MNEICRKCGHFIDIIAVAAEMDCHFSQAECVKAIAEAEASQDASDVAMGLLGVNSQPEDCYQLPEGSAGLNPRQQRKLEASYE